jgi:hypothetical protein
VVSTTPLQIVELRATNVKRLVAVTIRPDEHGNLVVLSGRNGAGKSSVLDAIAMALGGGKQIPAEPIRRGADHAEVVVDLGDLIVRRTFTPAGGGTLVVSNREGARFQSPQTMLDRLVGALSFDPLAFSREEPKRQAETLRALVGLDFTTADADRERIYAERTAVNRRVATLRARFEAMPLHEGVPAEPVDVADVARQLQEAQTANAEAGEQRRAIERAREDVAGRRDRVATLRKQLALAEEHLRSGEEAVATLEGRVAEAKDVDTAPLLAQIRDAEATNRKVRENQQRASVAAEHTLAEAESTTLTESIAALDREKAAAIAAAAMPVPGLGFSAAGAVTLNGLPLEQASAAERLRVSVAIGIAMNPRLRVLLIRDASLLDTESMRMVAEMAKSSGCQLWIERVEADDFTSVVIEDGAVADITPAEASPAAAAAN